MKVLVYYSEGNSFKQISSALSLDGHKPVILWADNFKEINDDMGDALFITDDVSEEKRERIIEHFSDKDILLLENTEIDESQDSSEFSELKTVEEVDAYIVELKAELEKANELRQKLLDQQEAYQSQKMPLEGPVAVEEKLEDSKTAMKTEDEPPTSDDESNAFLEETDDKAEYPTREQMILELRGLKDEGVEVAIPRNATLAQIKPLYDEHIRNRTLEDK